MSQNGKITTIYSVSLLLATLSGLMFYSSNVQEMSTIYYPVHTVEAKTKTNTVLVQPKEDWKENLSKNIWTIQNVKSVESAKKELQIKSTKVSTIHSTIWDTNTWNVIKKTILRNNWNDPRVQYAYDISKGNMDFILTIEAESRWDVNAVWDGWSSFGLCQIHKRFNPEMQKQYRKLKTDNEKIKMCYDQYQNWVKRWVIKTRLYWYNYRKARAYLFTIK